MASRDLAVAFVLGPIGSQAAPPPPACIPLFIEWEASYSNFRRIETGARIILPK